MTGQPTPKGAWKITFLLFLFMLVNFADKIVVGLAGVPIMNDLKLDAEQFGQLGSSFFLLFSISAIIVGFIVNNVATRWVLLAMAVIWSLAQFPMVGTSLHHALIRRSSSAPRSARPLGGDARHLQMVPGR
jgi:predicted MFS family arabinose efflux permease